MIGIIIGADAIVAAGCAAGLVRLVWLLHRDRGQCFRPGDPMPDIPHNAPMWLALLNDEMTGAEDPAGLPVVRVT
jgi:hypothetical protein